MAADGGPTPMAALHPTPIFNMNQSQLLLNLLQLASPALPVGAYSYSDGLETLVEQGVIHNQNSLEYWLNQELIYGAIRLEAAVMLRSYRCVVDQDLGKIGYWNAWLTASKETLELRQQSWQMGNSLLKLLVSLSSSNKPEENPALVLGLEAWVDAVGQRCNYAIAFGICAATWQIEAKNALLGYLQSWATNLISVGVKLIPLGQTTGQQILFNFQNQLVQATEDILTLNDDDLMACSWGLALASMTHETQYSRLFRS